MQVQQVLFGSSFYQQLCDLRNQELRLPLGLTLNEQDVHGEEKQVHFGIFHEHQAIACMILVATPGNKLNMRQVCVHRAFQGKGLGKKLLFAADQYARNNKISQIYCHAREAASAFYLQSGYYKIGDQFFEVGIPHWKMAKDIV